jgi:hypothetical protein
MLKSLFLASALATMVMAFGIQQTQDDKSTHHAAMHAEHTVHHAAIHAEHWLNRHVSATHEGKHPRHRVVHHRSKSVHHAAMHAEHWIDHHVSAPHQTGGN